MDDRTAGADHGVVVGVEGLGDDDLVSVVAVREEYKRRRDTVAAKLKDIPGVICECPRGAFYIMAALPVDSADEFQKWLLTDFDNNGSSWTCGPSMKTPGHFMKPWASGPTVSIWSGT